MNYTDTPDCGEQVETSSGYADQIICEIRELQALSEALHVKIYDLAGTCQEKTVACAGDSPKKPEPQNFCETSIKDLHRVRRVLSESLETIGKM
jgi:hypothetical protein